MRYTPAASGSCLHRSTVPVFRPQPTRRQVRFALGLIVSLSQSLSGGCIPLDLPLSHCLELNRECAECGATLLTVSRAGEVNKMPQRSFKHQTPTRSIRECLVDFQHQRRLPSEPAATPVDSAWRICPASVRPSNGTAACFVILHHLLASHRTPHKGVAVSVRGTELNSFDEVRRRFLVSAWIMKWWAWCFMEEGRRHERPFFGQPKFKETRQLSPTQ